MLKEQFLEVKCTDCRMRLLELEAFQTRLDIICIMAQMICGGKITADIPNSTPYVWDTANFVQGLEPAHHHFKDGKHWITNLEEDK